MLEYFSWVRFGILAGMYTFLAFASIGFRSGMAFSYRNAVPRLTILRVHLQYLAALLLLFWVMASLYPHLPSWMTDHWIHLSRSRDSDLSMLFLFAIIGMLFTEHTRIYVETEDKQEETQ